MTECTVDDYGWLAYTLGIALTVGTFISFVPQYVAIYKSKSSKGVSPFSVLLANISTLCNAYNILFDQWSTVECCHSSYSALECNATLLAQYQVHMAWLCTMIQYIFVLWYYPQQTLMELPSVTCESKAIANGDEEHGNGTGTCKNDKEKDYVAQLQVEVLEPSPPSLPDAGTIASETTNKSNRFSINKNTKLYQFISNSYYRDVAIFWIYVVLNGIIAGGLGLLLVDLHGGNSAVVKHYALALGILAAIGVILQWTPQIYHTWRAKEIGSLSVVMTGVQVPGNFLVVIFQFLYHTSVFTWLPALIAGIQQLMLFILCCYYLLRDWRRKRAHQNDNELLEVQQMPPQKEVQ